MTRKFYSVSWRKKLPTFALEFEKVIFWKPWQLAVSKMTTGKTENCENWEARIGASCRNHATNQLVKEIKVINTNITLNNPSRLSSAAINSLVKISVSKFSSNLNEFNYYILYENFGIFLLKNFVMLLLFCIQLLWFNNYSFKFYYRKIVESWKCQACVTKRLTNTYFKIFWIWRGIFGGNFLMPNVFFKNQ